MKLTSWREWPWWLKGGIIGVKIDLVIILLEMFLRKGTAGEIAIFCWTQLLVPCIIPNQISFFTFYLFGLGLWFILGGVVGVVIDIIYGKTIRKKSGPKGI